MKLWLILLFSSLSFHSTAQGAACCGGGFATPSIIAGDDKAQLTTSYSYSLVVVDNVDSNGIWRTWDDHQKVQTFRMEGAHLISDRWQVGGSIPVIQRSQLDQNYSGLGDISGNLAFEYLPDWNYNPFRPKGIGYLQITLPTGKSKVESEVGGLDSRGNGLWVIGIGTLLTKTIGRWDFFSNIEVHRSFEKRVSNSQFNGSLKPGIGSKYGFGGGFNTASWRFGASVTWSYEDATKVEGTTGATGLVEQYTTSVFSASYLVGNDWAGTFNYSDQTLLGRPVNTSLGRAVGLQLQKRWGR